MALEALQAKPEAVGIDKAHLRHAHALLENGVKNRVFPCATYRILRHGMIAAQGAVGVAQPQANVPVLASLETIFDLASITKTFTATLLLQHLEEGRFSLGQKVADFLPEAEKSPSAKLTLRQLATHTSGLPPWKALYKTTRPSALADILETPLAKEPGTTYAYSDLGYILLGEILARVSKRPLDTLVQERICTPVGMQRSGFRPKIALRPAMATTANCPMREGKTLVGEVHDANAHSMGGVAGHAGMFSDIEDMTRYALALRYPETAKHLQIPPLLSHLTRRLAQESQIEPSIGGHSIGWFTPPNGMLPRGDILSEKSFGHTGFTGTMLMFDIQSDLTLLLFTNRVYYPGENPESLRVRRLFANAIAGAVRL